MLLKLILVLPLVFLGSTTCPDRSFFGCVLRIKAQRVPFEKSIINVVFNIGTEAKLLHTCKVYSSTLPCFREKIRECGDDKQRRLLNEVERMLIFLCSPFSLQRQRLLMEHQQCISNVLALPAITGCQLDDYIEGRNVIKCRRQCSMHQSDIICLMRTWISEQNVCTLKDIKANCGDSAVELYRDMQTTVFDPSFPVLCEYEDKIFINNVNPIAMEVQIQSHAYNVTSPPIFVTSKKPPILWRPQKLQYSKEIWRKKANPILNELFVSTDRPLFTIPTSEATPSYKVINIIKRLLPENFPSKLSLLFKNGIDEGAFNTTEYFNSTPANQSNTKLCPLRSLQFEALPLSKQFTRQSCLSGNRGIWAGERFEHKGRPSRFSYHCLPQSMPVVHVSIVWIMTILISLSILSI